MIGTVDLEIINQDKDSILYKAIERIKEGEVGCLAIARQIKEDEQWSQLFNCNKNQLLIDDKKLSKKIKKINTNDIIKLITFQCEDLFKEEENKLKLLFDWFYKGNISSTEREHFFELDEYNKTNIYISLRNYMIKSGAEGCVGCR